MLFALSALAAPPVLDDPAVFPIAVWLQQATNADRYRAVGINLFIGQWDGPTDDQLAALAAAGMPVMADQNGVGLDDPIVVGWTQQDEPDNAQPDGSGGYGPCVDPEEIVARYQAMKAADPTRPVFLNLGQNVAWPEDHPWYGRGGECAEQWDQYPVYVQGADIVSFDIYPVTSSDPEIAGNLWFVAEGVDRLVEWTGGAKPVWNVIEASRVGSDRMPTPSEVETEVWMSLVHGSSGIMYFCHQFVPSFSETGCLDDPAMHDGLTAINARIAALAPVLNSPPVTTGWTIGSSDPAVPIDARMFAPDGDRYLFAVSMRNQPADATVHIDGLGDGTVEVLDEDRTLPMTDGTFVDPFAGYAVHHYRIAAATTTPPTSTDPPTVPAEAPTPDPSPPEPPTACGCTTTGSFGALWGALAFTIRRRRTCSSPRSRTTGG